MFLVLLFLNDATCLRDVDILDANQCTFVVVVVVVVVVAGCKEAFQDLDDTMI